ncbi:hypothetical protein DUNSADRAFT_16139 [Dunaliella salina]|uniref:Encoded protein n=1 Tax=Dunaliella salina TaxID=3046 RepID=A0ABZ3LGS6_DUNSA|nr:hypothetical protein DUNSADRAFT_16139 [Dunaliella salina]|eukprot:KAF5840624.1 hypothetical protein DUNSADRAFT_16139 [Dunaliella salina]
MSPVTTPDQKPLVKNKLQRGCWNCPRRRAVGFDHGSKAKPPATTPGRQPKKFGYVDELHSHCLQKCCYTSRSVDHTCIHRPPTSIRL